MFKNIAKTVLSAASVMCMMSAATPIYAENNTSDDTQISYTVTEQYTWTAPAAITFSSNSDTKSGTMSVTKNVIGYGKKLQIKIADDEDFKLVDSADASNTRTYKIKKGSTVLNKGGVVLEVASGTNTSSASLTFAIDSVSVEKAGSFSGTANFISSVVAS